MLQLDVKKLLNLPLMLKALFAIPIILLILYVAYFLDYASINKKLDVTSKKEHELIQQLNLVFKSQILMEKDLSKVSRLEEMVAAWQDKLVDPDEVPDLLESILKVGIANSLKFDELIRKDSIIDGEYTKIPISIVARGNYNSIARFLASLANLKTLIAIQNINIEKSLNDKKDTGFSERAFNKEILITQITLNLNYLTGKIA